MRGQAPLIINDFRGLFDRGKQETCPLNYFTGCENLEFSHRRFGSRGEFSISYSLGAYVGNIIGYYLYPRLDGTSRRLILHRESGSGTVRLLDIDHAVPPFVVATYSTDIDGVSVLPMFDRLYIAALTTKYEHKIGAFIQVYDGLTAARNAAGVAPSGASMTATEPGAGNVSAGKHLYAVAFETPSGFITKPGPAAWTNFDSAGSLNINLAGIPTGPAGTVNRHILATKVIPTYGPPQENFELFFVPGGTLAGNIATTLTIDFFDTELVNSADYLLDQYETIPAGPLFSIGNSIGVAGYKKDATPTGDKTSIALISKAVEIEAFSVDEGFVVVKPSLGGPLRNGLDLNGTLYFYKDSLTAVIQPDLDSAPAEWGSPGVVDSVIGTTPNGIASFMGAPFIINGGAFILTKFGLQFFNGTYVNLALSIENRFTAINSFKNFNTSMAVVDPTKKRVYMFVPISITAQFPDTFLVMDYKDGISQEAVRWCPWTYSLNTFRGMLTDKDGALQIATTTEDIGVLLDRSGIAVTETIPSFAETAKLRFSDLPYIFNYQVAVIGARGSGALQIDWYSKDNIISDLAMPDLTMLSLTDKYLKRAGNFSSQMASLKLSTVGAPSNYMDISSIFVFGHQEGEEFPE